MNKINFNFNIEILFKLLSKSLKNKIKNYFNIPKNIYQNVHMSIKLDEYHSGDFDQFHNKFCLNDLHLNKDKDATRLRNYINYKFAEYAIIKNVDKNNNYFLSVGISYGTTLKVITHLLDSKLEANNISEIEYFLIDNYKNIGGGNYNIDMYNVEKDLSNIKRFKFNFIKELLNNSSFDRVKDGLIFSHLNFGNYDTEIEFLPKIINKTKLNGVIVLDYYGWYNHKIREILDQIISNDKNLFKIVLPTLQCVLIKF